MNRNSTTTAAISRPIRWTYLTATFLLVLTGFGQMPIFKRYYIADIPGLGWLAQFFVTHYIHYLGAVVLLALVAYVAVDYLMVKRMSRRLTNSGAVRVGLLAGILASGGLLVIRNLAETNFAPDFIIFLNIAHLGLVMGLLFFGLYCRIFKKYWTTAR